MRETGFQTQVLTYRCKITIHFRHLFYRRNKKNTWWGIRTQVLEDDVHFIQTIQRDHYNSLCYRYCLCTATNNLCTLRWHKQTDKQTKPQTKSFSRTSMWGHIEELRNSNQVCSPTAKTIEKIVSTPSCCWDDKVYVFQVVLRLLFSLSPGYLHPGLLYKLMCQMSFSSLKKWWRRIYLVFKSFDHGSFLS